MYTYVALRATGGTKNLVVYVVYVVEGVYKGDVIIGGEEATDHYLHLFLIKTAYNHSLIDLISKRNKSNQTYTYRYIHQRLGYLKTF